MSSCCVLVCLFSIRFTFKSIQVFFSKISSLLVFLCGNWGIHTFGQSSKPEGLGLRRGNFPTLSAVRACCVMGAVRGPLTAEAKAAAQTSERFYWFDLPPVLSIKGNPLDFFHWFLFVVPEKLLRNNFEKSSEIRMYFVILSVLQWYLFKYVTWITIHF